LEKGLFQYLDSMAHELGEPTEKFISSALIRYISEAHSEARKRMTPEELEASYRAMAADEEGEAEAREWVNAYLGESLPQTARTS
jgi:hypothetical protein